MNKLLTLFLYMGQNWFLFVAAAVLVTVVSFSLGQYWWVSILAVVLAVLAVAGRLVLGAWVP